MKQKGFITFCKFSVTAFMNIEKISECVSVYQNGMNCVIIQKNGKAALINCNPQITLELMASLHLNVKTIICLNYRSSVNGGILNLRSLGAEIAAPQKQAELFTSPKERLGAEKYRFHVYDFHPDNDLMGDAADVSHALFDKAAFDFEGIIIDFFEMKGDTVGELGCVIHDSSDIGVCADIICGDDNRIKIPFLYRMCKDPGTVDDYHAFMAEKDELTDSLRIFENCGAVVPARGDLIGMPALALAEFAASLEKLYQNYSSASAMNHYYPGYLKPSAPMAPAKTVSPPKNVRYLFCNYLIISPDKRGFLLDCGTEQGLDMIEALFASGELAALDACYITHYHHDHVDMLEKLQKSYNCEIYAPQSFADMLKNPEAYYITCLSDVSVSPKILPDNYSFTWENCEFTNFEFPGQSLYHGGLLFDDKTAGSILFCGDSFAPTGFDDYCPQNRNFTGENRGYRKCLDIIEKTKPGCIINQHQEKAFVYTEKEIAFLRANLEEREPLLRDLTMWPSPDYSLDPYWVRMYPYVSRAEPGKPCPKEIQITNHTHEPACIRLKFGASAGVGVPGDIEIALPPKTSGLTNYAPADVSVPVSFDTNEKTPAGIYAVKAEVWLNGVYFGEICKGVILVF